MIFEFFCVTLFGLFFGTAIAFAGYSVFRSILPMFGFVYGFALGAHGVHFLFGVGFLTAMTSWMVGLIVGIRFCLPVVQVLQVCHCFSCWNTRIWHWCNYPALDRFTGRFYHLVCGDDTGCRRHFCHIQVPFRKICDCVQHSYHGRSSHRQFINVDRWRSGAFSDG
jgi:hypothetical protein